jgi:hypothetical protein
MDDNSYKMTQQDVHGIVRLLARTWGSTSDLRDFFPIEALRGHRIEGFY